MKISILVSRRYLRALIFIPLLIGVFWFFALATALANQYTVTLTPGSVVIMGDGSATLPIIINSDPSSTNNIGLIRIDFDNTIYKVSNATNSPSGWSANFPGGNPGRVRFTTSTNRISPGGSETFNIVLVGVGGISIPSASSDQTDTIQNMVVREQSGGAQFSLIGSFPTWERKALSISLSASPSSLGNGNTISVSEIVENRSNGTLSNITPSALTINTTGTAGANYLSGPTPSSVASLASGASTTFDWSYTASSAGTVQFSGSASDGATTSTSIIASSNIVDIGDFTASLSISPTSVLNDYEFTITMTVINNGGSSLTNVTPSTLVFSTSGSATHSITSGPTPATISSLAPSASDTFEWKAKVFSGISGDTFTFQGDASSDTLTTLNATSNQGEILESSGNDRYTVTVPSSSFVTMGEGTDSLSITVSNDLLSPDQVGYVQIDFDNTIYDVSSSTSPPTGWSATFPGGNPGRVRFSTSTNQISPGFSETFNVILLGSGGANIPSASSDQTDAIQNMSVRIQSGGTQFSLLGSFPTWGRKALSTTISASPSSLGNGATITVSGIVTNRSSGTLNNITPSALTLNTTGTAGATYLSGPTPSSVASLLSGDSAIFEWSYSASSAGTVQFSGSASDGATTSTSITDSSNSVDIGDFTATLSLDPTSVTNDQEFTVSMMVANNGITSLGNVTPSTLTFSTSGPATHSITSGPTPTSMSSLAPGTSGTFEWKAKVFSGSPGDTFSFDGDATSDTLTTSTATSNQGDISGYSGSVSPSSISSGSTDTLTFSVVNDPNNTISLNRVDIFIPSTPSGFTYQTASGSNTVTAGWNVNITQLPRIRFTRAGGTNFIDPGDVGEFEVVFSQAPTVISNTEANFVTDLRKSGAPTFVYSLDITLLITAYDIVLTATPQTGIPADEISTSTINATLTSGGSPLVGKTVNFSSTKGTLSSSTAVSDSSGVATVSLTSPTSTTNTSATVTASYLGASNDIVVSFTGVTTPNIVYVGGSLSPTSVNSNQSGVSVSLKANNTGGSSVTLSTASTFSFSDGTNTYISNLSSPTLLNAGATNITLSFDPISVAALFMAGSYSPTMSLTDGGSYNQNVPVSDNVTVTAPNMSVSMSVDISSVLPGATVTYTMTYSNSGTGLGENIQVTNNIPLRTTYEIGSITWDDDTGDASPAITLTDISGDDEGDYGVTNPNSVTVSVGIVGVGIAGEIEFKATID